MYEGAIQDLIDELGRLPGVGPKSAQRIAFHVLSADPADVNRLAAALQQGQGAGAVLHHLLQRRRVGAVPDLPRPAPHRRGDLRRRGAKDVVAVERTGEFRGRYHVLGGAINPLEGIGPDNLRIRELMTRLGARRRSRS